jgi:hypothetical protein
MQVVGGSGRVDQPHEGDGAALVQRDGCLLDMRQHMDQVLSSHAISGRPWP